MKKYLTGRFSFRTDIGKVRLTNEDQAIALTNASGNILLVVIKAFALHPWGCPKVDESA